MAKEVSLTKRSLITKANQKVVISTSVAAFMVVFCLVASKTLISQVFYQNKVISKQHQVTSQIQSDLSARTNLINAYQGFTTTPQNILGGNPNGTGSQDGNNSKIVLDALPSTYDFPALATTLENILNSQGLNILSISGTDDELAQESDQSNPNPQPVQMPFDIDVTGSYQSIQNLINVLQQSIRPFQILQVDLSGNQSDMTAEISAQTYYQPQKTLSITKETIK